MVNCLFNKAIDFILIKYSRWEIIMSDVTSKVNHQIRLERREELESSQSIHTNLSQEDNESLEKSYDSAYDFLFANDSVINFVNDDQYLVNDDQDSVNDDQDSVNDDQYLLNIGNDTKHEDMLESLVYQLNTTNEPMLPVLSKDILQDIVPENTSQDIVSENTLQDIQIQLAHDPSAIQAEVEIISLPPATAQSPTIVVQENTSPDVPIQYNQDQVLSDTIGRQDTSHLLELHSEVNQLLSSIAELQDVKSENAQLLKKLETAKENSEKVKLENAQLLKKLETAKENSEKVKLENAQLLKKLETEKENSEKVKLTNVQLLDNIEAEKENSEMLKSANEQLLKEVNKEKGIALTFRKTIERLNDERFKFQQDFELLKQNKQRHKDANKYFGLMKSKDQHIERLSTKIRDYEKKIATFEEDKKNEANYISKISLFEEEVANLKKTNTQLAENNLQYLGSITSLSSEKAQLQYALDQNERELTKLKRRKEYRRDVLEQQYHSRFERQRKELDDHKRQNTQTKEKLLKATQTNKILEENNAKMHCEYESVNTKNKDLEKKLEKSQEDVKYYEKQFTSYETHIAEMTNSLTQKEDEHNKQIIFLEKKIELLQEKIETARHIRLHSLIESDSSQKVSNQSAIEFSKLQTRVEDLHTKNTQNKEKIGLLYREKEIYLTQLKSLKKKYDKSTKEHDALLAKMKQDHATIDNLNAQLESQNDSSVSLSKLEKAHASLQKNFTQYKEKMYKILSDQDANISSLRQKAVNYTRTNELLNKIVRNEPIIPEEKTKLLNEVTDVSKKNSSLTRQVTHCKQHHYESNGNELDVRTYNSMKYRCESLEQKLKELQDKNAISNNSQHVDDHAVSKPHSSHHHKLSSMKDDVKGKKSDNTIDKSDDRTSTNEKKRRQAFDDGSHSMKRARIQPLNLDPRVNNKVQKIYIQPIMDDEKYHTVTKDMPQYEDISPIPLLNM